MSVRRRGSFQILQQSVVSVSVSCGGASPAMPSFPTGAERLQNQNSDFKRTAYPGCLSMPLWRHLITRKNHAPEETTRLLRARKLLNRRFASI
jgi:hypothetical protein